MLGKFLLVTLHALCTWVASSLAEMNWCLHPAACGRQ